MKKYCSLVILITLFISCHSAPRYAKDVLELNNFDFNLDLDIFFDDELYFRDGPDRKLQSSKKSFDDTTYIYYTYWTFSYSHEEPLAKYKDVLFEKLYLLSDSTDQHPLVVTGSTNYASTGDVETIIKDLLKIDDKPVILAVSMSSTSIVFKTPDRIITVYLNISVDDRNTTRISIDENYKATKKTENILTDSKYEEIISKLQNKEKFELSVFVIDPTFDRLYNKYQGHGSSGFMTEYRTN